MERPPLAKNGPSAAQPGRSEPVAAELERGGAATLGAGRAPGSVAGPQQASQLLGQVVPALLYCVLVFWLGTLDGGAPSSVTYYDKLGHALAFGLMQVFNWRAARALWPTAKPGRVLLGSAATSVALGLLLEVWQLLLTYRQAEWLDGAADVVGVLLVSSLQWRARRC